MDSREESARFDPLANGLQSLAIDFTVDLGLNVKLDNSRFVYEELVFLDEYTLPWHPAKGIPQ